MQKIRIPVRPGISLILAAFGYLIESFGFVLLPEMETVFGWVVGLTAGIGKVSVTLWLIIKDVRAAED